MTKDEFIKLNRNVSADTLRLKFHDKGLPWLEEAITQIECIGKAGKKFNIGDRSYLPETLVSTLSLEQATAPVIARFHASLPDQGSKILDITMGLGIDSSTFAINGATKVTGCEINPELAEASRKNYAHIPNLEIINTDSIELLNRLEDNSYDLIFADPARRGEQGQRVYNLHDCTPDLIELTPQLRRIAPRMLAKLSPMLDVSQTISDLSNVHTLYIVDDSSECKEILADVRWDSSLPTMIMVKSGDKTFAFTKHDEASVQMRYALPETGDILYEPSPAMMKAAPFKLISNITAGSLADNTHLYLSESPVSLPGRQIRITGIHSLSSSGVKEISRTYSHLNIAVRNFPSTVKDLVKKLKIKEGGNLRAIAVTLINGQRCLIVGEPISQNN